MDNPSLGRLESVDPRTAWTTEDRDFTPWLARPENLEVLAGTLHLELELEAREQSVGPFRADILCKEVGSDSWVLIENQLERTDHVHLGQLLTYAAGLEAVTIIWIAKSFTDEHRAALDWLNRITDESFRFFGLEVELWRIGESPAAPRFNVVSKPNDWSRALARSAREATGGDLSEAKEQHKRYWDAFHAVLNTKNGPIKGNRTPLPQHYMTYSVRRTGFHLSAVAKRTESRIWANLYIHHEDARAFFGLLERDRKAIETDFGEPFGWVKQKSAGKRSCRIELALNGADPTDEADWPRQHEWLADKLNSMHRVFSPRIVNLDAADWRDEDAEPEG